MTASLSVRAAFALATWFGCGYSPVAPGTVGTLGALAVAYVLHVRWQWTSWHFVALALVVLGPSLWAAGVAARESGRKDPSLVVIDEVLGVWITLAGAPLHSGIGWLLAFGLFRLFDIWKPPPVRQLERLPGGAGIIADDLMAGVYSALVLWVAGWFNLY